jgi:hypothetical protein
MPMTRALMSMSMSIRSIGAIAAIAATIIAAAAGSGCSRARRSAACADIAGPACNACRDKATAQFCAPSYVAPQASGNIKVNGQKGCCGFEDPTLRANCENILACVRSQGCGSGNSPIRCLCGDQGMGPCAAADSWSGPCAAVYTAALAGGPPGKLIPLFGDPRSPIGVANNTFTCDVDAACPCGAKSKK